MRKTYQKPGIISQDQLEQTSLSCNTSINLDWYTCVDTETMLQRDFDCSGRQEIAKGNSWATSRADCSVIVGGPDEVIGLS